MNTDITLTDLIASATLEKTITLGTEEQSDFASPLIAGGYLFFPTLDHEILRYDLQEDVPPASWKSHQTILGLAASPKIMYLHLDNAVVGDLLHSTDTCIEWVEKRGKPGEFKAMHYLGNSQRIKNPKEVVVNIPLECHFTIPDIYAHTQHRTRTFLPQGKFTLDANHRYPIVVNRDNPDVEEGFTLRDGRIETGSVVGKFDKMSILDWVSFEPNAAAPGFHAMVTPEDVLGNPISRRNCLAVHTSQPKGGVGMPPDGTKHISVVGVDGTTVYVLHRTYKPAPEMESVPAQLHAYRFALNAPLSPEDEIALVDQLGNWKE